MRFKPKRRIPKNAWLPLLIILITHTATYYIPMVLTAGYYHYDLTTALDRAIPFLTISIIPYVLTYPYWYFGFLLAGTLENKHFFHIFVAIELLHVTTFFIFLFFPTTVVRPEVTADTLCSWLTTLIYTMDQPTNLFPSMHCYASWMLWISVRGQKDIRLWYRRCALSFAIIICICTQTIKQHYLPDMIAGVALAELFYWAVGKTRLPEKAQVFFSRHLLFR